jgi:hypothetical protein
MSESGDGAGAGVVEVRPEVVFLSELLQELTRGRLRIPRFQRPFIWRRDQMTDLLDSVYKQYPIGSLLVWETAREIATLDRLGPFTFPEVTDERVGYVLDGHQRLATLAGALVAKDGGIADQRDEDPDRWRLAWNMAARRFQHMRIGSSDPLFPLSALLDTLTFFQEIDALRYSLPRDVANGYVEEVSRVARAFQQYRVPVIRIRETGLSEAVEIFARLNSKGQAMSADQMVSALMYRQDGDHDLNLASEIDELADQLGQRDFADVDRTTILRAILANLDEDIYRTDWTRLAADRRETLQERMRFGVQRTTDSLGRALDFLARLGVNAGRLLPYAMQLVVLSAFFDRQPEPTAEQFELLRRWFWVSSFSGWFGGANPSRVNSLVAEFRRIGQGSSARGLENFDLDAQSLPYPATFDMRSARTRCLLLVLLSLEPKGEFGATIPEPWRRIAEKGPSAVGQVFYSLPEDVIGNPANRIIRPPEGERGSLRQWLLRVVVHNAQQVLLSHAVDGPAAEAIQQGDIRAFILARQRYIIEREREFQVAMGVRLSDASVGATQIDTD